MTNRQQAFTLAEMTVVLLIIALIAAAATLRVQGPLRSAQQRDLIDAIRQFDHTTRMAAREQDRPLRIVVDADANELRRTDDQGRSISSPTMRLPGGFSVERIMIRGGKADEKKGVVPCSREGLTPSYGLELNCRGVRQWVLIAGLSGKLVEMSDEDEARTSLHELDLRPDAR
jgi:prepilin-type N-terminal cleavage/methylation domain-containing protein